MLLLVTFNTLFPQHDILAKTRGRITRAITFSPQNDADSRARSSYLGKSCPRCRPRFNVWASVVLNCTLGLLLGCYHFFHWPYENSFPRQSHDTIRDNTTPVSCECHAQPPNCQFFWYSSFLVYLRTYTPKVPIRHWRNERESVLS